MDKDHFMINDREYFHQLEIFFNTLESSITKSIMSLPKESSVTKSIVVHKGSVAPCATLRSDGRHVSIGRQVPRGRQVPTLTLCDTFPPDGHHISIGQQVLRGCQVPSLTLRNMFRP